MVTLVAKRVNTNHKCCWDKFIMIRTSSETQGQLVGTIESSRLQYSSQIVETDTVLLKFLENSRDFYSSHFCSHCNVPSPSPILSHAYFEALRPL